MMILSSHSCHIPTFSNPSLIFYNFPGKTFIYWRKGRVFLERNWMNELLGKSSEDPGNPCWIFVQNSISTVDQGWRSCKIWLGSHGSLHWSCWMWSPIWGTVPAFSAPQVWMWLGPCVCILSMCTMSTECVDAFRYVWWAEMWGFLSSRIKLEIF